MKLRIAVLFTLLLGTFGVRAQIIEPVSWKESVKALERGEYEITFTATIDPPWHIYDIGPYSGGPIATTFTFAEHPGVKLIGKIVQKTASKKTFDENFGMEIGYIARTAVFSQRVKVVSATPVKLETMVEWQVCDDQSCLPPAEYDFVIPLDGLEQNHSKQPDTGIVAAADTAETAQSETAATAGFSRDESGATISKTDDIPASEESRSLFGIILAAVLWGFAALITPCVFPMVPMTVSFFLKGSGNKRKGRIMASFYGFSIVALYTLPIAAVILITYFVGGAAVTADIFNWLSTHWLPNVLFSVIFILFAISFFGAFEIVLPSWMVNKSDTKADKGGLIGTFFMALTLVLVSFSCTGPIVGTILVKSTQGEIWEPIITMFAFSVAFALPFTLFAFFPSLLQNLPKSGGWLNSVKVVLGFIELALGLKFLSVADQTYHWGLLDREVYLALWIVIFTLMGIYLLGKIRFAHDSDVPYVTVKRLFMSIATFAFVVYLIPGMFGAPLKALSGYLPPMHTLDFNLSATAAAPAVNPGAPESEPPFTAKYSDFLHMPHGLQGFFDFEEGMAYARKAGKPVFLDFTGHGCVNCREMEANVWSDPKVLEILINDYVLIALYVDDRKALPENEWFIAENGKEIKTIGKKNARFQVQRFGVNAQPYYVLLDHNEKMLVKPRGYNKDVNGFVAFLNEGLEVFKSRE